MQCVAVNLHLSPVNFWPPPPGVATSHRTRVSFALCSEPNDDGAQRLYDPPNELSARDTHAVSFCTRCKLTNYEMQARDLGEREDKTGQRDQCPRAWRSWTVPDALLRLFCIIILRSFKTSRANWDRTFLGESSFLLVGQKPRLDRAPRGLDLVAPAQKTIKMFQTNSTPPYFNLILLLLVATMWQPRMHLRVETHQTACADMNCMT